MGRVEVGSHLVFDSEICHGQLTFKGTRVPVDTVLTFLAKGYSVDQLLRSWPELTRSAVEEAIHLASRALQASHAGSRKAPAEVAV